MAHHSEHPAPSGRAPGLTKPAARPQSATRHAPAGGPPRPNAAIPAGYKRIRLPEGDPYRYLVEHQATMRRVVAAGLEALLEWVRGVDAGEINPRSAVPGYTLEGYPAPEVEVEDPDTQEAPAPAPEAPAAPAPPKVAKPADRPRLPQPAPQAPAAPAGELAAILERQERILGELAELKKAVSQLDQASGAAAQRLQSIHGNVADIQTTVHALAEAFLTAPGADGAPPADGAPSGT